MGKEKEVLTFLRKHLFNRVLALDYITKELESYIVDTIKALKDRNAVGMVHYFWSTIGGGEMKKVFQQRLMDEGFLDFEEVVEEFKVRFNGEWLRGES